MITHTKQKHISQIHVYAYLSTKQLLSKAITMVEYCGFKHLTNAIIMQWNKTIIESNGFQTEVFFQLRMDFNTIQSN